MGRSDCFRHILSFYFSDLPHRFTLLRKWKIKLGMVDIIVKIFT
jgi:hypothetical protein